MSTDRRQAGMSARLGPRWHLGMNTLAFTVCFAAWMMNGVLVTFLVGNRLYDWDAAQMGWLMGAPVLSGALMRLPVGALTDRYGGRIVYSILLLTAAVPMFLLSQADSYLQFLLAGLGFGLSGASFAIGIAYTSVWFPRERQGFALGVFGVGNAGAALTSMGAPVLLGILTQHGANLEGWRTLPQLYAAALATMAVLFFLLTRNRKVERARHLTISQQLAPLKKVQVWRFSLYYFLVFGGFVALSQWLIPYYTNVYAVSLSVAGLLAMTFSLPSGVIRAAGGWMSDRWGARPVMQWVLGITVAALALSIVPPMDITTPGGGVVATRSGTVLSISPDMIVTSGSEVKYELKARPDVTLAGREEKSSVLPVVAQWHEPAVKVGDRVERRQVLARGVTSIYYPANMWVFTVLLLIVGVTTGIGKAAVYRYIPDYFPRDVGVVGGLVGLIGALGGFVGPIVFGYMLKWTGMWTTTWVFLALLAVICFVWLRRSVRHGTD